MVKSKQSMGNWRGCCRNHAMELVRSSSGIKVMFKTTNDAIAFVEEILNEGSIMKDKPVRKNLSILKVLGHTHVNKDSTVLFDIYSIKPWTHGADKDYGQE